MNETKVPSFLLEKPSTNVNDSIRLLSDMQLLALWNEIFPSKPFNYQDAVKLQIDLATKRAVHLRKEAKTKRKTQEIAVLGLQSMRRHVAEQVMQITLAYDEKELSVSRGDIGFGTKIGDALTGTDYGTIRELLLEQHVTWESCGDPIKDLEAFIQKLKRYDDYAITLIFDRLYNKSFKEKFSPRNVIYEVINFPRRPVENVKLSITLKWQPFKNSEVIKKLKKQIREVTPHVG